MHGQTSASVGQRALAAADLLSNAIALEKGLTEAAVKTAIKLGVEDLVQAAARRFGEELPNTA